MLPLGGMFISIFTGWYLDRRIVREEVTGLGEAPDTVFGFYIFLLKFVAPVAIASIFVNELFK